MTFAGIFFNRHDELRWGWKLFLFTTLLVLVFLGIAVPLYLLKIIDLGAAPEQQTPTNLLLVLSILLVTWVMTRKFHRKPLSAIGLVLHPGTLKELGMGCLLGFLMMTGVALVERGMGAIEWQWVGLAPWQLVWTVLASAASFLIAATEEELLFRGYPFQVLMQGITFLPATILSAVLFGAAHLMNPHASVLGTVNTALIGVLFAFAYMKTRGLWLPIGLHFAWNFSQTTLYGLTTSGVPFHGFQFVRAVQSGPEWITGGAYGPEAGVPATIAVVAALWYILKAGTLKAPAGIITLDSIEDLFPSLKGNGSAEDPSP
jgi:CAAX protease family protein